MLIFVSPQRTDRFFARMVIPRSRSRGFESITRSATCWLARNVPAWRSMWSTSVVFPWSTCAMIAMLRIGIYALFHREYPARWYRRKPDPGSPLEESPDRRQPDNITNGRPHLQCSPVQTLDVLSLQTIDRVAALHERGSSLLRQPTRIARLVVESRSEVEPSSTARPGR